MARPIRFFEPGRLQFVTTRCHQAQFLLRPDEETTQTVGAVVARALHLYPVKLYGFMTMSNHVHAIVQGESEAIASWARYTFGEIARRVNKNRGRRGAFWGRRYSAEAILDDGAVWGRLIYLLSNPVQSHLVAQSHNWPGFSTLHEALGGEVRLFPWFDAEGYRRAQSDGVTVNPDDFTEYHPLVVARLPDTVGMDANEYVRSVEEELCSREEAAARERRHGRKRVVRRQKLLTVSPTSAPPHPKRSQRPLCHTTRGSLREAYRRRYHAFREAVSEAVDAVRRGLVEVRFPPLAFRPPFPPPGSG